MCDQANHDNCEILDDLHLTITNLEMTIADLKVDIVEDLNINFFVHASTNVGTTKDRAKILMMKWEAK